MGRCPVIGAGWPDASCRAPVMLRFTQFLLSIAMTSVYHELRPDSYLLLLTPGAPTSPERALDYSLTCASRSGKVVT